MTYNRFYLEDETIDETKLQGGVKIIEQINTGNQLTLGVASAKQVTFTAVNLASAAASYIDKAIVWKVSEDGGTEVTKGTLYVKEIKNKNDAVEFTCYDSMCLFDVIIDDWLNSVEFPTTLGALLQSLCDYCGVFSGVPTLFTNYDAIIYDNITTGNLLGRSMLQWIAQFAAVYMYIDELNRLRIGAYNTTSILFDNSQYAKLESADYECDVIDKVQVQVEDDDIGVIVGEGENVYIIKNNPLFYAETDGEIRQYVQAIYDKVSTITYTPMKLTLLEDLGVNVGDIIKVNGKSTYIMSKEMTPSGVTLQSIGLKRREVQQDALNEMINGLRGKYNKLKRELDETVSEIGDMNENMSNITQGISNIELSIQQVEGNLSDEIEEIRSKSEIAMTPDEVTILVREELIQTGVDHVVTENGFAFNNQGLTITKTGSALQTNVNENGMRVTLSGSEVLSADQTGVIAKNLKATTYLIIGKNSRFEDYQDNRTGCFWIGQ